MKINSLKNIYNYCNSITAEKPNKFYKIGNYCLNKIGDEVNLSSIDNMPKYLKILLRYFSPSRIKEMAQMNLFVANKVKGYFDKLYGAENYTVIAVGRSVASIAETMKALDTDVKIIPLSGLRDGLPRIIPNLQEYENYLNSIGISKQNFAQNPNKKYILFDYSSSGNTLEAAQKLFEQKLLFPNNGQLTNISINEIMNENFLTSELSVLFNLNRFKIFSPVGKLNIFDLKKCFAQSTPQTAEEYSSKAAMYIRKLFLFHIFDNIKTPALKVPNIKKEMAAVDRQYLCPEAARVRLIREITEQDKYFKQLEHLIKNSEARVQKQD